MNSIDSTGIRMHRRDFHNLPAVMRKFDRGNPMVLAKGGFAKVILID